MKANRRTCGPNSRSTQVARHDGMLLAKHEFLNSWSLHRAIGSIMITIIMVIGPIHIIVIMATVLLPCWSSSSPSLFVAVISTSSFPLSRNITICVISFIFTTIIMRWWAAARDAQIVVGVSADSWKPCCCLLLNPLLVTLCIPSWGWHVTSVWRPFSYAWLRALKQDFGSELLLLLWFGCRCMMQAQKKN